MLRANRRDRDETFEDDLFLVYFDPFLDQQRAYVFTVNGYGVQGDAILNSRGPSAAAADGVPRGDASWDVLFDTAAEIVGRRIRTAEMAIPFKSIRYPQREAGRAAPVGAADRAHHRRQGRGRRLVAHVARHRGLSAPDGPSRRHDGPLAQPQPRDPAHRHRDPVRLARPRHRPVRRGGCVPEGGVNVKYGVTSNLTADVTFNPDFSQIESDLTADRGQPAVRAVLPRAAPLLPGRRRDLQHPGADHRGPHPHHRRSRVRRQADRQGGTDHPRGDVRQRRGAGKRRRCRGSGLREGRAHVRGPGALRPLHRVARRGHLHRPGAARRLQPARRHRLELPPRRHPRGRVPRHADRPPGPSGRANRGLPGRREVQQERPQPALRGVLLRAVARVQDRRGVRPPHRPALHVGDGGLSLVAGALAPQLGARVRLRAELRLRGVLQDEVADAGLNLALARNMFVASNVRRELERFGGIDFHKTRARVFGRVDTSRRVGVSLEYRRGEQIRFDEEAPYLGRERGITASINLRPVHASDRRSPSPRTGSPIPAAGAAPSSTSGSTGPSPRTSSAIASSSATSASTTRWTEPWT